jgi:hypothetical protein
LLYIDGNLPDKERQQVAEHLSICAICVQKHDALALVWQPASTIEKVAPSPELWRSLQTRINVFERTPIFAWDFRIISQGLRLFPIPALVVFAAIVVGLYLGTPREFQGYAPAQSPKQFAGSMDEFGLDQFDMIPPGTLGSTLVKMPHTASTAH